MHASHVQAFLHTVRKDIPVMETAQWRPCEGQVGSFQEEILDTGDLYQSWLEAQPSLVETDAMFEGLMTVYLNISDPVSNNLHKQNTSAPKVQAQSA
jgi:hypothetical protein